MLRKRCTVNISFIVRTSLSEVCGSTGNAIFIATVLGIRLCISIFRRLSAVLENGGYCTDRRCRRERDHSFTGAFKLLFTIFFTRFYKNDTGLVPLLGSLARFQKMLKNPSSQAYACGFSANFAADCVKNPCRAKARLRIFAYSATKLCSKIRTLFL